MAPKRRTSSSTTTPGSPAAVINTTATPGSITNTNTTNPTTTVPSSTQVGDTVKVLEKIKFLDLSKLNSEGDKFLKSLIDMTTTHPNLTVANVKTRISLQLWEFLVQEFSTTLDIEDSTVSVKDFISQFQTLMDNKKTQNQPLDFQITQFSIEDYIILDKDNISEDKLGELYLMFTELKRQLESSITHNEESVCEQLYESIQRVAERKSNPNRLIQDFYNKLNLVQKKKSIQENKEHLDKLIVRDSSLKTQDKAKTLDDLKFRIGMVNQWQKATITQANAMGMSWSSSKVGDKRKSTFDNNQKNKKQSDPSRTETKDPCTACGNRGHTRSDCRLLKKGHPNCNQDDKKSFVDSDIGKKYAEALTKFNPKFTDKRLSARHVLKGTTISETDAYIDKGKLENLTTPCLCHECSTLNSITEFNHHEQHGALRYYPSITTNSNFVDITIREKEQVMHTRVLLDNGAFGSEFNYIDPEIAKFLINAGNKGTESNRVVCGALSDTECQAPQANYTFSVNLTNEFNKPITLTVNAAAIATPYPVILSREFIKQHSLVLHFPSHFLNTGDIQNLETFLEGTHCGESVNTISSVNTIEARMGHSTYQEGDIIKKEELLDISPEDDGGLTASLTEDLPWEIPEGSGKINDEDFIPKNIVGDEEFVKRVRAICLKYINVFKREVNDVPANLKPMEILVDKEKWAKLKNRKPRLQSRQKQSEIEKQISQMLRLKIIKPSDALLCSQVLLAPKPNNKWRFCVDYRELNSCSQAHSWPLPNIRHTLSRLGEHKAEIFGVMDMTSGFNQAPLAEISKIYTAFTSWAGNYQYDRVPFGLKGAPSYYQQQIQSEVLRGLMYKICEAYIDDIITFGKTQDEFCTNLEKILQRFQLFNITVNPDKCRFGMDNIEYVGHTINRLGMSFTDEKRESVAEFPLPEYPRQLHQFIGLTNYFRDHVNMHSDLAKPLTKMLSQSVEKQKLIWTEELKQAFETLKYTVHNCRMLFFVDVNYPIHVCTDASGYGIGAYVYQIIDGQERPIQYISKSLSDVQRRWSTVEKEAYSIWYTFHKLEYLLRDVKFTLHTDHVNLTFINDKALTSDKVYNWKIFIQQFNFDIQYIKGKDNVVADSMSRLCAIIDRDKCTEKKYLNLIYDFRVPEDVKTKFTQVHNSVVGHKGVKKTVQRLREAGVHITDIIYTYIKKLVSECVTCQRQKFDRVIFNTRPFTTGTYAPMECLNIDTIGPFPVDKYGFKYIINIIDQFSRYCNLIPTKEIDALSACNALIQHVGTFGRPYQILTDNGTQFVNEAVNSLVKILKCQQIQTTPYSKEQAAIVERSNKEVNRYLIAIVNDENCVNSWSDYVPLVKRIINSTAHEAIGVAPSQLITPKVALDRGMIFHHEEPMENISLSDWISKMLDKQNELIHVAQQIQSDRDGRNITRRITNRPPSQVPYEVGGYVLLEHPSHNNRRQGPTKLSFLRDGPYQIVKIDNRDYTILDLITNKTKLVDINRLVPFVYDKTTTNPEQVAARSRDMYIIESILQHRRNNTFLVKWAGYDEPTDNTWEPLANIRNNEVFHQYCRDHNLLTLIPTQFRQPREIGNRRSKLTHSNT
jgi:transposase InsO family protein